MSDMVLPSPEVFERAFAFARSTNRGGVQEWMLWEGWEQNVGCHQCADEGPDAPCWGVEGCHGFSEDCGCRECVAIEAAEREADRARALAAVSTDIAPVALHVELAQVGERIDQPRDGRAG